MPDTQDRRGNEFAKFDAMSTEELQQLLREDASKPVGEESDTEVLFYVMEVLAKRRKERNEGKTPEEALESFKQKYYTGNEKSSISENAPVAHRHKNNGGRWFRGMIAAAAMLMLIVGSSLTASALGFDLWDIIVKWTQETFHFGYVSDTSESNAPDKEDTQSYIGLQDALLASDIQISLAPTWLPNGYIEMDVKIEDTPIQRRYAVVYQSGENTIRIRIVDYLSGTPSQIEQSDTLLEIYSVSGINYYIFENNGQLQAVWINQNFECYISGPLTLSEIKEMIDSIEKG